MASTTHAPIISRLNSELQIPSTSSGPPTTSIVIAERPSTWMIRQASRSGNHADNASATGIMNAVPSDPTRSLVEPSQVPFSGRPTCKA